MAVNEYKPTFDQERKFWDESSFLANVSYAPIMLPDGTIYPTLEHAYVCAKYPQAMELLGERNIDILNISPEQLLRLKEEGGLGQLVEDWDAKKRQTMWDLLVLKFTQHPELRIRLINTRGVELIEQAETETSSAQFWGVDINGVGYNVIGRMLMQLRYRFIVEDWYFDPGVQFRLREAAEHLSINFESVFPEGMSFDEFYEVSLRILTQRAEELGVEVLRKEPYQILAEIEDRYLEQCLNYMQLKAVLNMSSEFANMTNTEKWTLVSQNIGNLPNELARLLQLNKYLATSAEIIDAFGRVYNSEP